MLIERDLQFQGNILCLQASNLAPKMDRRRLAWQLARGLSSVAR